MTNKIAEIDDHSVMAKFSKLVVENPKKCFFSSLTFLLLFLPGLALFQEEYNVRIWFRESDPNIKVLDQFERQFGNDENMIIVLRHPEGIFNAKRIKVIHQLTEGMWKVPQIIRVDSLTNYNFTQVKDDDLHVSPFFDFGLDKDKEYSALELEQKKNFALRHKVLPGYLISPDANSAMIFARLAPSLSRPPNYELIVEATKSLIKTIEADGIEFHLLGEASVNDAFRSVSLKDSTIILPMLFLLVLGYLLYSFRSITATLLPIIVMVGSVLATFGLCFYVGHKYNEILTILPAILLAVSIADSVHIIMTFFQYKAMGEEHKKAVYKALKKNMIPTIMTSLTTAIGFLSLMNTELMPIRQLGLLGGFGTFVAWFLTIFTLVPILLWVDLKTPAYFYKLTKQDGEISAWALSMTSWIKKHALIIIILFSSTALISVWVGAKNRVNSNPYMYFSKNIPLRQANDFVKIHFGGNSGPEIMIHAGKEDGIKDPAFLKKVEAFKAWLDALPAVNQSISILEILKETHQNLHQGLKENYVLADSQEAIAQELLLFSMGLPQGMDMNNQISVKSDSMRLSVLWKIFDTRGWLEHVALIEHKAKEMGLVIDVTGKFLLFQRMMDYVVKTFFFSILTAFVLVAISLMIIFRSVKLGLLSMIPNVAPLFYGSAAMYFLGMELNIGTALVASVTMGIAVDDTIHFLANYSLLKRQGRSNEQAVAHILSFTGPALIMTTIILVSAFGIQMMGDFIPNVNFGALCAIVLSLALICDLVFLPAILLWQPFKKKNEVVQSSGV